MKINFKTFSYYFVVIIFFLELCALIYGAYHLNNRFDELERAIIQMKKDVPTVIQDITNDIKKNGIR